jgi:hypothetical protein
VIEQLLGAMADCTPDWPIGVESERFRRFERNQLGEALSLTLVYKTVSMLIVHLRQ